MVVVLKEQFQGCAYVMFELPGNQFSCSLEGGGEEMRKLETTKFSFFIMMNKILKAVIVGGSCWKC